MSVTYTESQQRMIREARRIQERADAEHAGERLRTRGEGRVQGYEMGKAEQAERDVSRRWHDAIFAFLVGGIAGFLAAAVLTAAFGS